MAQQSTDFTATGQSPVFTVTGPSSVRYYADFSTGSGVGTVQLQCQIDGDWLPADTAVTGDMTTVEVAYAPSSEPLKFRWNCSAYTSGTITCYLG